MILADSKGYLIYLNSPKIKPCIDGADAVANGPL